MTCRKESCCTRIALMKTMSGHRKSAGVSLRTFMSINRRSQAGGSSAETVISPSGGMTARLPSNLTAWRKLQYVSGNSGYTSKTRIIPLWKSVFSFQFAEN
jgi:hypothetical protein